MSPSGTAYVRSSTSACEGCSPSALSESAGLAANRAYTLADRERDIRGCRDAYVGAAVTDIAMLRGALTGRLSG